MVCGGGKEKEGLWEKKRAEGADEAQNRICVIVAGEGVL